MSIILSKGIYQMIYHTKTEYFYHLHVWLKYYLQTTLNLFLTKVQLIKDLSTTTNLWNWQRVLLCFEFWELEDHTFNITPCSIRHCVHVVFVISTYTMRQCWRQCWILSHFSRQNPFHPLVYKNSSSSPNKSSCLPPHLPKGNNVEFSQYQ